MDQELEARPFFWPPHRSAIAVASICIILGLAAYLIVIVDSYSGGYGRHVPFPALRDYDSLRMKLTRTFCLGTCPDYSVEVRGDGTVIYEGKLCVAVRGHHDGFIPASRVDELFEAFKKAEFLSLRDYYFSLVTDNPTYVITLTYFGVSKTVTDYSGKRAGMPNAVTALENTIDEIAGTATWVSDGDRRC